jgi:hypothetical protein
LFGDNAFVAHEVFFVHGDIVYWFAESCGVAGGFAGVWKERMDHGEDKGTFWF